MHSMNLICIQKQPIIERLFAKGYTEGFQRFQKQATKMCEVIFWHVKVCLFWKCIQYTIHWDKAEMLKRFSSDKIISIKNFLFFILQAPTHHSFFFLICDSYTSWSIRFISLKLCEIFHLGSVTFLLKFIFLFNKKHVQFFVPRPLIFELLKKKKTL